MELTKVFVGDGSTSGTSVATLAQGDLLLLDARDNSVLTASTAAALGSNVPVKVAAKNPRGVVFSTPMKRSEVSSVNYKAGTAGTEKVIRFPLNAETYAANTTYSLGVMLKENQRAVYNREANVVANYATGSSVVGTGAITDYAQISSAMAKQFALSSITGYGFPNRMVKVERYDTGSVPAITTLGSGANATVTQGSRVVTTAAAHSAVAGTVVSLAGVIYVVDKVNSTTEFIIDVPYEGSSATVNAGTTVATNAGIVTFTGTAGATSGLITFKFTGLAQTRENKYSQFTTVNFNVIYPRGFVASGSVPTVSTAKAEPFGTWRQVRDMEELYFTQVNPQINYREFPFQDFDLNVNSIATTTNFNQFTVNYMSGNGYNFMGMSDKGFPQTLIVFAPTSSNDGTVGSDDYFSSVLTAWYTQDDTPSAAQFA